MKHWSMTLVAAAAALALQACDVQVRDAGTAQSGGGTTETAATPAASGAPAVNDSTLGSGDNTAPQAQAQAPADGGLAGTAPAIDPSAPGQPQTGAMGGPAAETTAPGVAAPTELGQYLQQNPVNVDANANGAQQPPAGAERKSGG